MEKPLDKHLDDVMGHSGVVGVLCADKQGLCLGSKGCAERQSAGLVASLSEQASQLMKSSQSLPIMVLEGENVNILIKTQDNVTTAVYKTTV